ncbi:MAG: RsmB/NOP family class I SAM-dependent RNA methyltransferase [Candidatus Pacearchaeota archaeon]|nr:RsmB/NOP family class I SAM-dependent RNA methyltransferase [Candidatus Pacearchaeota archaeon]
MRTRHNYEPKPLFLERMQKLMGKEMNAYLEILKKHPVNSIRCNTLKISPEKLKKRLEEKPWSIEQPFKEAPEIMIIKNELLPGELGRSLEHLLGYYYVQEIASMLPVLALKPKPNELILDIAAAPGSKTTQIAAEMNNTGTIIANDVNLKRLKILASNAERCGVLNAILTKRDGIVLCQRLKENNFLFDKILVDAPCSGEGTIRSSPATYQMWNPNTIKVLSRLQKSLLASAIEILKPEGELVYSTCTHAPEENEEVVDFALNKFKDKIKVEKINLPVKCRSGIISWEDKNYDKEVKLSCRIYPQDNNTEGFFIAKIKRIK